MQSLLPSETAFLRATRFGFEHGLAAAWFMNTDLELTGGIAFPVLVTYNAPTSLIAFVPSAAADLVYTPVPFLALAGGTGIRLRSGADQPFESLDPRLALRLYFWRGLRSELAAAFPLGGRDRTDVILAATLGWLEPPQRKK